VRGGRSLNELNALARAHRSRPAPEAPSQAAPQASLSFARGDDGGIVFLAVSVDPSPHAARAHGPASWSSLKHYWIDGAT